MSSFGITLNCLIAFTTLDISFLVPKENTYIIVEMDISLFILEMKFLIAEGYIKILVKIIMKFIFTVLECRYCWYLTKRKRISLLFDRSSFFIFLLSFFFQQGLIFLVQSDLDIKTETFFINTRWNFFFTSHKYKVMHLISCF